MEALGMQIVEFNPEVFFARDQIVNVSSGDLAFLEEAADHSQRRRARVCAHKDAEDVLHEMIVVLKQDAYLIPEKHFKKVESYHIIKGAADVVIFDEVGNIKDVVELGDYSSGRSFYFRVRQPDFYHTVLIRSDFLLYHEAATGPFRKDDTLAAPWAPEEGDIAGRKAFMEGLERRVTEFLSTRKKDRERK